MKVMASVAAAGLILVCALLAFKLVHYDADLRHLTQPAPTTDHPRAGLSIVNTTTVYDLAEPGLFTVVEFFNEQCIYCRKLKQHYPAFLEKRPDVAIKRIRLSDDWRPKALRAQYQVDIRATPHVLIFDKDTRLIREDVGMNRQASDLLFNWVEQIVAP